MATVDFSKHRTFPSTPASTTCQVAHCFFAFFIFEPEGKCLIKVVLGK